MEHLAEQVAQTAILRGYFWTTTQALLDVCKRYTGKGALCTIRSNTREYKSEKNGIQFLYFLHPIPHAKVLKVALIES
uniref:Transposase n=1 Tax=Steinernema glaseri TaxID=37863 RepID=A0A1I8ANL7_9BILA